MGNGGCARGKKTTGEEKVVGTANDKNPLGKVLFWCVSGRKGGVRVLGRKFVKCEGELFLSG